MQIIINRKTWCLSALALATGLTASVAEADILHHDDVIIGGGLCIGSECADGEIFGFESLKIKSAYGEILFEDISTTDGGYPYNDWRLIFNDVYLYGESYFAVQNETNETRVFTISALASENSLYLGTGHSVGIGTPLPEVELHIVGVDTPTLRLEQRIGAELPIQIWDVGGNESNFFVRDAESQDLPFRIQPGAKTNSLFVAGSGYVGIGTEAPTGPLDVSRDGIPFIRLTDRDTGVNWALQNNSSEFRITTPTGPGVEFAVTAQGEVEAHGPLTLSNDGPTWTALEDISTGVTWNYQNNGGEARITTAANPGIEFALATNGNLTILGEIFTAGSCSAGCDRVFEPDYDLRSIREHAKLMWTNGHLPAVGPTAEEGSMNLSEKVGGMLNELEHAHIYIAQLEEQAEQDRRAYRDQIAMLEERLGKLEAERDAPSR